MIMAMCCAPAMPRPPISFKADHPFLIILQHYNEINNILFIGQIMKPKIE